MYIAKIKKKRCSVIFLFAQRNITEHNLVLRIHIFKPKGIQFICNIIAITL